MFYNYTIIKVLDLLVIIFNTPITFNNSLAFKDYYDIVLPLLFSEDKSITKDIYVDTGFIIITINRSLILKDLEV